MKTLMGVMLLHCFVFLLADGSEMAKERRLMHDLLSDYDRYVLPKDGKGPVMVNFDVELNGINRADLVNGILSTQMWIRLSWWDPRLRWNPSMEEYGVERMRLKPSQLWLPDIFLFNSARNDGSVMADCRTLAIVSHEGNVTLIFPKSLDSWCELKKLTHRLRPIVSCKLKFGSWTFSGDDIDFSASNKVVSLSRFQAPGRWSVKKTSWKRTSTLYACCPETYPSMIANLVVQK